MRKLRGDEDAERVVELDLAARLGEQRVRGLPPTRRDEKVAVGALAVEDEPPHAPLPALGGELARPDLAEIDDLRDLDARLHELVRDRQRVVIGAEHDRSRAGPDREVPDEAPDAVGEHHADEVVPAEHERLFGRAGRDDDPLGTEAIEQRARVDRNEAALPDPERAGGREHLHPGELEIAVPGVLVDEDDAGAAPRGFERRRPTRCAAADDEHARAPMLRVVAPSVAGVRVELPEPRCAAQELLVQRPRGARPDERPVVEADRSERPAELVGHRHEVEVERPADVLALHDGALADRLGADADVRHAVDGHLAVRAVTRAAEEPAWPVVLERAREDALAGPERGGGDRVAFEAGHLPAGEA